MRILLAVGRPLLEKREKWRTPDLVGIGVKNKLGLYCRNKWPTLYNRVGVVKRHLDPRRVLTFLFVGRFCFCFCRCFCSCDQGSLAESCGGTWFHQPSIRSLCFRP